MRDKRLKDLLAGFDVTVLSGSFDIPVRGISTHSGEVRKGDLFVALKGERTHGLEHLREAVERGAVAVLFEEEENRGFPGVCAVKMKGLKENLFEIFHRFYGNPSYNMMVCGITGTNGKTTTAFLIHSINTACGFKSILISSVEIQIGDERRDTSLTTPDTGTLFRILSDGKEKGCSHLVMEVTSIGLDRRRGDWISFDMGIFTNITRDHLDYHGSFDEYMRAKRRFFKEVLPSSPKRKKAAVINLDDPLWREFLPPAGVELLTFSVKEPSAEIYAEKKEISPSGIRAEVKTPCGIFEVCSSLIGFHNLSNILGSIGYGIAAGLSGEGIIKGIEGLKEVPGRLQKIASPRGSVFIDYAHTPDALLNVLRAVREITKGRVISLFGCGGDRDRGKRPEMGKVAYLLSDAVVITSDNPRSEDPLKIIEGIMAGVEEARKESGKEIPCIVEVDRKEAIRKALSMMMDGDSLVIAGKGHERYQILKDRILPFSDAEEVQRCLTSMK